MATTAPTDGTPVYDANGNLIGTYVTERAAKAETIGDVVRAARIAATNAGIKLRVPPSMAPPEASKAPIYDATTGAPLEAATAPKTIHEAVRAASAAARKPKSGAS
jgi:hypothetical protein